MMRGESGGAVEDVLFDMEELECTRAVGQGSSAVVYVGEWRGLAVAVKVFRGGLSRRAEDEAERERAVHRRLRHPNVVGMLGEAGAGDAHALVFEYCPAALDVRALGGWVGAPRRVLEVSLDVARALEYAHTRGVMHRDVKPSQVLLLRDGRAKLADWGLACHLGSAECGVGETGTLEFMAPEVVACTTPYGAPADVFSFGVTMWCIMAGEVYPYAAEYITPEQAADCVARGTIRPRALRRLDPELTLLIQSCWAQDPRERPTMTQVVNALLALRAAFDERPKEPPPQGWWPWFW